jgi:phosphoribosylformylglycinamidine cyclo-ligase
VAEAVALSVCAPVDDNGVVTTNRPASYAEAGVDVDAAEALVSRFAELARSARRPEVLADIGPFAGLFNLGSYREPVLVASSDSVGTKVKLAAVLGRYRGVGHDLVNHCVNDILTTGAEPLFFLDYIGNCGLSDDAKAALVKGCVEACREAGAALLGGETADMPGTYREGDFDLVGFIVGVVERDAVIDGSRVEEHDVLIGLPSSGLHTNGYTLVRNIFEAGLDGDPESERAALEANHPGLEGSLGDALLEPHRSYLTDLRRLGIADTGHPAPGTGHFVRGIAHITGGGIPGNVPRILPEGLCARIDRSSWRVPAIFRLIEERGGVKSEEMFRTFNMGLGLVLAVAPDAADEALAQLPGAWVCGEVVRGKGVEWAT